ncbi:hypothetical protein DHEL01_v207139 [Diaporthe helianthi]|uniref:Uncharacterized protein n=1 Tax=Diaporthe helianthi TaxID=158607 RepID=A0A2P5HW33_DIAHE|nr:hypothetical protein DHEL01_v207139 [Diaporthe helianthi]
MGAVQSTPTKQENQFQRGPPASERLPHHDILNGPQSAGSASYRNDDDGHVTTSTSGLNLNPIWELLRKDQEHPNIQKA